MAKKHTDSALGALEVAAGIVEGLHEEMTDWQSNMEGSSMEHLPKYEQVSECVDALDNADVRNRVDELVSLLDGFAAHQREAPELVALDLDEVMVTYEMSTAKRQSRADRLGEAQNCMAQALDALDFRLGSLEDADAQRVKAAEGEEVEEDERLGDIRNSLEELRESFDALGDVQFPGMYG
jgi:hypothetical protein